MTRRRRILVVDDDATLRETLVEVLSDDGFEVRAASDGARAVEELAGWRADLVVLDLMMPRMDGFAFQEAQRAAHKHPAPVLILSAAPGLTQAAEQIGAVGVVAKPFRLNDLMVAVERGLGQDGSSGPAGHGDSNEPRRHRMGGRSSYHFSR